MAQISRGWSKAAFILFLFSALLIGHSLYVNLTRVEPVELRFSLTVDKAGSSYRIQIAGTRKLYSNEFDFEGSRASFTGRIDGDRLTVTGSLRHATKDETRTFRAEGEISGKRMVGLVLSDTGSRIGRIEFTF
jgi:hypothetical protein